MKNLKRILFLLLLTTLATFSACNSNKNLKEEKAKKAGENMIAQYNQNTPSNFARVNFIEWQSFLQIDEKNAELRAVVVYSDRPNCRMKGMFHFMKINNGDWILDGYSFNGDTFDDTCGWNQNNTNYKIPE